jgi:Spy/CpxP family protein refolding chaperone
VGDEGLEQISYYPIKHKVLDKSAEQVVANAVANPTLSETVALLIESWSRMTPRQKAWLSTWLQPGMENWY